jgi:hypothetical protein
MEQTPQDLPPLLKGLTAAEFRELMNQEVIKRGLGHWIAQEKPQDPEAPQTLTIIFQPLPPRKKEQP